MSKVKNSAARRGNRGRVPTLSGAIKNFRDRTDSDEIATALELMKLSNETRRSAGASFLAQVSYYRSI
jgi:hypothetical protein